MSAFIVSNKTINQILSHIRATEYGAKEAIQKGTEFDAVADVVSLGQAMYNMNANAVGQRYGESAVNDCPGYSGRYQYMRVSVTPIQALKSLKCYLYQCSEGNIMDHPLYKALDKIVEIWALDIVRELPEYEAAGWDD